MTTYVGYPLTFWWDEDDTNSNEWCNYQEPHTHGFACEPTCPCKDRKRWDRGAITEAPLDTADYGSSSGPQERGPDETFCRRCNHLALDHTEGRFSIYGTCPPDVTQ